MPSHGLAFVQDMTWRRGVLILAGAAFVGGTTVGAATGLYYAFLPAHLGPENSSPPPEAFGVFLGALLGCAVGVALVVIVARSIQAGAVSFGIAACVGSAYWLAYGSSSDDRLGDVIFGVILCGVGAALGLSVGAGYLRLRKAVERHRAA